MTMYRRTMGVALGAALLALAVPAGRAADDKEAAKHMHGVHAKCAQACAVCMLQCEGCARHCAMLLAKGETKHLKTLATCADCGDFCALAAKVVARHGPMSVTTCEACAKVCDTCAKACEEFPSDEHMKACAKACRDCAMACRDMVKHAGHAGKDKAKGS
jgi:hypothetical protein